jgi:single-stranded DNA-binding protein
MSLNCAGYGAVIKNPEIRQSKTGSEYANILVSIDNGVDADGKETTLVLKLIVFSDLVEEARKLKKSDRAYFEGTAGQIKIWESDRGPKPDIQIRLHHLRRTQIGKDKPKPEGSKGIAGRQLSEGTFRAEPHRREKPYVVGRSDPADFEDRLPF